MPLSMSHGIPAGLRYALFDHSIEHDFGEQRLLNFSLLKYLIHITQQNRSEILIQQSKLNSCVAGSKHCNIDEGLRFDCVLPMVTFRMDM